MTLDVLITNIGYVLTGFVGWIPQLLSVALSNVLVQFFLGVSVVAVIIGFSKRILRVK